MELVDLFVSACMPVLEVLIITALGSILALDHVDALGDQARNLINHLVFYVLSPALVVSQLGSTITLSSLVSLWFMPVNILLTFMIGSVLAWILIKITKTPPHLQGLVVGCCSAGNLGNLLLIIVPAVCEQSNSPFGDSTTCSTYGKGYASLSMAVGVIYIWTYVYFMMRLYTDKSDEAVDTITAEPNRSSGKEQRTFQRIKNFAGKMELKMVFAPSTIAATVGFIIGSVSPIRNLVIGTSAPLSVLYSSAALLAEASIPAMTLIVGSNLVKGLRRSEVSIWVIIGVIVVRFVLMPVMGVGVVKLAYQLGMVGSDSLYQFVLLLQYSLPPAMAVGVISQLFKAGESECSVIMLWTYIVAAFALTLWSTFYMWLLA